MRQSHFILNFLGTSSCFDVHLPGCSQSSENCFKEWNISPAKWFPTLAGLFQTVWATHAPCLLISFPVPQRPAALSVLVKSVPWFLLITKNQNTPVSGRRMGRWVLLWVQRWVMKSASRPYRQAWLVLLGALSRGELCVRQGTVSFRGRLHSIFTETLTSRESLQRWENGGAVLWEGHIWGYLPRCCMMYDALILCVAAL